MKMAIADQRWREFNQSLIKEAQNINWGLYRNIRFEMAEFLKKEKKLKNALETYLEVLYLDQNGPANNESIKDNPEFLREHPPFDPKLASVAPGVIDCVRMILEKFKMKLNDVEKIFILHNKRIHVSLKTPITPDKAWSKIDPELRKAIDSG